jgi:hypothetical protein
MDDATYEAWRKALGDWLEESKPEATESACAHPAARPVLRVLALARQTMAGINATAADVSVQDLVKYDHLASILDTVLSLESFSLAEYTYNLPGDRHPGLRLWYESQKGAPRISAILFEDVHEWRVDMSGEKISWQALYFDLAGDKPEPIIPKGAQMYVNPDKGWRSALIDALCLPVRLFR